MKRKYVDERGYVEYDPDGAPGREDFVWPEAKPLPKRKEKIFERWRPKKNPWNVFTDEPIRDWRLNWRYPEWHLQGLLKDVKVAKELYSFAMRRNDVWIEDDKEQFMKLYSRWLRTNGPEKHRPKSKRETAADVLASLSDYREVETAADVLAAIRNDPALLKESAEDVLAAVRQEDISDYVGQGKYTKINPIDTTMTKRTRRARPVFRVPIQDLVETDFDRILEDYDFIEIPLLMDKFEYRGELGRAHTVALAKTKTAGLVFVDINSEWSSPWRGYDFVLNFIRNRFPGIRKFREAFKRYHNVVKKAADKVQCDKDGNCSYYVFFADKVIQRDDL